MNLNDYRDQCGEAAHYNGWHKRFTRIKTNPNATGDDLLDHIVSKTAMIGCEVAEAIEELRDGHGVKDVRYTIDGHEVTHVDDTRLVTFYHYLDADGDDTATNEIPKPVGYPTELADVIIRALDLAWMLGIDIDSAVREKLEFNASRGQMHGGKTI